MVWNDKGYGRSKGFSSTVFASCTFDNIVVLILFGICKTIAFKDELEEKGLSGQHKNNAWAIGGIFVHVISGLIGGVSMGLIGSIFRLFENKPFCIYFKAAYCIITAIGFIIASELSTFKNANFIACLSFGYTS